MNASACLAVILLAALPAAAGTPWSLDFEAAMVTATRNDVAVPGDAGTPFSLVDDLSTDDDVAFRVRLGRRLGGRHSLAVLYAPLRLYSHGQIDAPVDFNGTGFPAGADLDAIYQFDSYRLTWLYDLVVRPKLELGLGLTAKVRDAFIELDDGGGNVSRKDDLGVVPLVHVQLDWRLRRKIGLLLEADALAGPQGRAEDVLVALALRPWGEGTLRLGFRVLEGGVDVDAVYNFALVQYYVFGWGQRF
ncbi:MAG TPA: hypothetical protein PLL30_01245 [Candidatus Krumholzibacteria bacterium]|nr:hypothetical protein [Candidatus Krumholzibacteria bacterium]HPD70388.1 hypothetical protein [Candidatus Krumholzibacteria bacterium]HRY39912.1 hypothetical protein [Candidatus Krumholzibacteria bacterium]